MATSYDSALVILSILIAIFTSYTALGLGNRVITSESASIKFWISGGAITMGIGIWSMHFIGMLAFQMPVPMAYDLSKSLLSILPAILASAIALFSLGKHKLYFIFASLLMGTGITGMHYIGMAAMDMDPPIQYNPLLVIASFVIAVVASGAALFIICKLEGLDQSKLRLYKFLSSILMGLGISGMHYTGMSAAIFNVNSISLAAPSGITATTVAILVTGSALLVLLLAITVMIFDNIKGQNRFYSTLLDAQSDVGEGVMLVQDMKIIFSNPAIENLLNYSQNELLGLVSPLTLLPSEERDKVEGFLLQSKNSIGTTGRYETGLLTRNGDRLECEVAISSFNHGEKVRTLMVCLDITDRKRAVEKLREMNETLEERVQDRTHELKKQHQFIETILDIERALVLVLDRQGRIVRSNHACEALTSYSKDQLRGKIYWEHLVQVDSREDAKKDFNRIITSGESIDHEDRWLSGDKQIRLISWSSATINGENNRPQYVISTGIDITDQKLSEQALLEANEHLHQTISFLKNTQEQLVHAEKMASLGSLVAGFAHEINTPLGIGVTSASNIREQTEILQKAFESSEMKRSDLEQFINHSCQASDILLRNLQRASDLIRGFKQVAIDQSSDEWRAIDLQEYFDEVILSLKPKWKPTATRLINDCDPGLVIYSHPGVIYQVLSNLILNALIYAFDDGQEGKIMIDARRDGDFIHLGLADTGKGIPKDHQQKIFDPFFTTRRGSGGSGLGLHIVYNLVTGALKGSIECISNEFDGTKFHIVFPIQKEASAL